MKAPEISTRSWVKELGVFLFLGLMVVLKFWMFLIPKDRFFLTLDFTELVPMRDFFYAQLRNGLLVTWDTHLATGMPYLAADMSALYPPDLLIGLFAVFYNIDRLQVLLAFHYWLGGCFLYLYSRQLGLGRIPGLIGGLTFMLGGFLIANPHHRNLLQTFIWLPLVLYFLDQAFQRGSPFRAALAGLTLGFSFLAGHANFFFFILIFLGGYCLFRVFLGWRQGSYWVIIRDLGYFFIMTLFCIGLSLPQLIAILATPVSSYRQELDFAWKTYGSFPVAGLIGFFLPEAFRWTATDLSDQFVYIGVFPLLLGIWAFFSANDLQAKFFGLIALAAFLVGLGDFTPLYRVLYDVMPGLELFRIPARSHCLTFFSLAMLSGYGSHLLLVRKDTPQEKIHQLYRTIRVIGLISLAGGVLVYLALLFLRFQTPPMEGRVFEHWSLLTRYWFMFLLVLGGVFSIVSFRNHTGPSRSLAKATVLLIAADLWLVSLNYHQIGGHMTGKDPATYTKEEQEMAERLKSDPEIFRVSNKEGLLPQVLRYQKNIETQDLESMPNYVSLQFPKEYQRIQERIVDNPRLLDLLNVKYWLGKKKPEFPVSEPLIRMGTEGGISETVRERVFPLALPQPLSRLSLVSNLALGEKIPQGQVVAEIVLYKKNGTSEVLNLRAGLETCEWSIDNPEKKIPHHKIPPLESFPVAGQPFEGHFYRAEFFFSKPEVIDKLKIRFKSPQAVITFKRISLNDRDLFDCLPERFEYLGDDVYRNRQSLPRAFLIEKIEAIPNNEDLLERMARKDFDPASVVFLNKLPAGYSVPDNPSSFSDGEVHFRKYSPQSIHLATAAAVNKFLLLTNTYHSGWQANLDGKPVPVLKANYGFLGVYVPGGRHHVEFIYHDRPFHYGLWGTGITLFSFVFWSVLRVFSKKRDKGTRACC